MLSSARNNSEKNKQNFFLFSSSFSCHFTLLRPSQLNSKSRKYQHFPLFFSQSQFRFDNECYLNLPDNHKRVSLTPQASFDLNAVDVSSMITDDNDDDGDGSSVVARTSAAISANESNFNLVYDDFNLASVSMPVFFFFLFPLFFPLEI